MCMSDQIQLITNPIRAPVMIGIISKNIHKYSFINCFVFIGMHHSGLSRIIFYECDIQFIHNEIIMKSKFDYAVSIQNENKNQIIANRIGYESIEDIFGYKYINNNINIYECV